MLPGDGYCGSGQRHKLFRNGQSRVVYVFTSRPAAALIDKELISVYRLFIELPARESSNRFQDGVVNHYSL